MLFGQLAVRGFQRADLAADLGDTALGGLDHFVPLASGERDTGHPVLDGAHAGLHEVFVGPQLRELAFQRPHGGQRLALDNARGSGLPLQRLDRVDPLQVGAQRCDALRITEPLAQLLDQPILAGAQISLGLIQLRHLAVEHGGAQLISALTRRRCLSVEGLRLLVQPLCPLVERSRLLVSTPRTLDFRCRTGGFGFGPQILGLGAGTHLLADRRLQFAHQLPGFAVRLRRGTALRRRANAFTACQDHRFTSAADDLTVAVEDRGGPCGVLPRPTRQLGQ
ncbi:hypothetical protein GCM10023319_24250 [Nocardia iowensis]